jgi:hypothetical protein
MAVTSEGRREDQTLKDRRPRGETPVLNLDVTPLADQLSIQQLPENQRAAASL